MTGNTPVRARLAQPPTTPAPAGQGGDWRQQAPCRQPCLETAPRGPQAHNDHHGIFAGTTAKQRITLRGRPSMAQGTRFLQDRAEEALALANRVSIDRAAQQLGGPSRRCAARSMTHGLGQSSVLQGGPERRRFYHDAEAARAAWQRAAEGGKAPAEVRAFRQHAAVSHRHAANPTHEVTSTGKALFVRMPMSGTQPPRHKLQRSLVRGENGTCEQSRRSMSLYRFQAVLPA